MRVYQVAVATVQGGCLLLDQVEVEVVVDTEVVVVDKVVGQEEVLGLQMLGRGVKMSESF